ncbi:hypothetical protein V6N13_108268 [Hibiscus sabdariffa]
MAVSGSTPPPTTRVPGCPPGDAKTAPRRIPLRGQVLKTVLKAVLASCLCSYNEPTGTSSSSPTKNIHSNSLGFPS